ncbi:EZH inhibitory protein-like [Cynocephalus volans]|uniref:EZH inhibitory protein-like n=1 Tax=Cynocephalus volans TaxID=110931 RepID=UPI002FC99453
MATRSHGQKEQKLQQGEVPAEPNDEAACAPGEACGTGNHDPVASVPTAWSDVSPSGSVSLRSSPAGSSTASVSAAISMADEDPGLPSMACVPAKRRSDPQGRRSPHAELRQVVPKTDGQAALGQAPEGTGQASGHPSPGNGRRRERPCRQQAAQAQKPPGRHLPQPSGLSPPSSPRSRRRSRRRRRLLPPTAPQSPASRSGPALRSQPDGAGAALRDRASDPGAARRSCTTSPAGPALRRRASGPGPAIQVRATRSDPAVRRRPSAKGPAPRSGASQSGLALPSRDSPPGPASHGGESGSGSAVRRRCSSAPGPALRDRSASSGLTLSSTSTAPGPVLQSRSTQRRSALLSRHSLSGPAGGNPSPAGRRLVFRSSPSPPDPQVPSLGSQPTWHAVRMRASSPSPPGRFFPFPEQYGETSSSSCATSSSSFTSSPRSPSRSPSSSPTKFFGLSSISTPSPASLRRALLPEVDALSPAFPGEQAERELSPPYAACSVTTPCEHPPGPAKKINISRCAEWAACSAVACEISRSSSH